MRNKKSLYLKAIAMIISASATAGGIILGKIYNNPDPGVNVKTKNIDNKEKHLVKEKLIDDKEDNTEVIEDTVALAANPNNTPVTAFESEKTLVKNVEQAHEKEVKTQTTKDEESDAIKHVKDEEGLSTQPLKKRIRLPKTMYITSLRSIQDFKTKVLEELKNKYDFTELDESKIEIKNTDGISDLTISELVKEKEVKIKIKTTFAQSEYINRKTIKIYWTEDYEKDQENAIHKIPLPNLNDLTDIAVHSSKKIKSFKLHIMKKIKEQPNFKTLTADKIEIKRSDGTDLTVSDLIEGNITVKVTVLPAGEREFMGEKDLNISWTREIEEIDLSTLKIDKIIFKSFATIEDFKKGIVNEITKQPKFEALDINDIDFFEDFESNTPIYDFFFASKHHVVMSNQIAMKITNTGSSGFKGQKEIYVTWLKQHDNPEEEAKCQHPYHVDDKKQFEKTMIYTKISANGISSYLLI